MLNPKVQFAVSISVALLFLVALFTVGGEERSVALQEEISEQKFFINPYDAITVEGKSVYVLDVTTDTSLFERDSEQQLPLASLTKLMTTLIAEENSKQDVIVEISEEAVRQEGDSGIHAGERWKLSDLLALSLIASSNDAAFAISETGDGVMDTFVKRMNERAKELRLSQTYFTNPTGLDYSLNTSGSYGSARDMAELISYLGTEHPHLLEYSSKETAELSALEGEALAVENTNRVLSDIPALIGSKTGYTDLAGGNLAILFDAGINRPVAIVVLGSSFEGRFEDVKTLAWATLKYIQRSE